jgi:hypothetical protein
MSIKEETIRVLKVSINGTEESEGSTLDIEIRTDSSNQMEIIVDTLLLTKIQKGTKEATDIYEAFAALTREIKPFGKDNEEK